MQIIETTYKWAGTLARRSATRRIILHHAAAVTCTPQQVHQWHLANGWSGIGYHFFVRKDGSVYRGRPEDTVGAHAGNNMERRHRHHTQGDSGHHRQENGNSQRYPGHFLPV